MRRRSFRDANVSARAPPSRDGTEKTPETGLKYVLTSAGGAMKLYYEVAGESIEKR
jgi:hypothetical protein